MANDNINNSEETINDEEPNNTNKEVIPEVNTNDENIDKPADNIESNNETKTKELDKSAIETNTNINTNEKEKDKGKIKPTSSRQEVEVDKIFKLLQDAKKELKDKSTYEKDRKERIDKIINEIPQSSIAELKKENNSQKKVTVKEAIKKVKTKEHRFSFFNFTLIIIIFALCFLIYENSTISQNKVYDKLLLTLSNYADNIQKEQLTKIDEKEVELKIQLNEQVIQNELLAKKLSLLKNDNSGKIKNKVSDNRNLLKENSLLKIEQEKYSNEIVSLRINKKISIKKIRLLTIQKEKLAKEIQTLKKEDKTTKESDANKVLLKQLNTLKIEQQKYSDEIESLKTSKKTTLDNLDRLTVQKELLEKNIQKLKEQNISPSKSSNQRYVEIVKKEFFPAISSTSKDYKIVKCYDLKAGDFYLSQTCKRDITKFVKENNRAKRFEIIGVVDNADFTTLYKENPTSKNAIELQKYNAMGLARYRVLETSWFLTEQLETKVVLTPVNYTITSKKSNRGTIIRAYYK